MTVKSGEKGLGPVFWLCASWIVLVFFSALTAQWWAVPPPDQMDWDHLSAPPGTRSGPIRLQGSETKDPDTYTYRLGTDTMGRDMVSRLIFGARISLSVGFISPLMGFFLGGFMGCVAGFYRGRADVWIVSVMDIILAFPALVLLLAITFCLGPGLMNLIFALGFLSIPAFCRVARAKTLALSNLEFVQAARMTGAGDLTILLREIIPNVIIPVAIYGLLVAAFMIMAEGALSFLGLGPPPPFPSWGGMISEGREVLEEAPHVSMIPAGVLFLTVLSFNLLGDQLQTRFQPGQSRI